ncbi:MAG: carbon monoxide dehydrogenase, partial [Desulfobacterales bacterium]
DLRIGIGKSYLIVNQVREALPEAALRFIQKDGLTLIGTIPLDDTVYTCDLEGHPMTDIPADNLALKAAFEIFDKIVP